MITRTILFLTTLALALSLSAAHPSKEPWKWTLEERFAKLMDGNERSNRVARHVEMKRQHGDTSTTEVGDILSGKMNPELFLPTELFRIFVANCFTQDSAVSRRRYQRKSDDLLLTPEEWAELEPIVAGYAAALLRERELLARGSTDGELESVQSAQCLESFRSLKAARHLYTGERFDRYLYTVIAPTLTYVKQQEMSLEIISMLRAHERGCE